MCECHQRCHWSAFIWHFLLVGKRNNTLGICHTWCLTSAPQVLMICWYLSYKNLSQEKKFRPQHTNIRYGMCSTFFKVFQKSASRSAGCRRDANNTFPWFKMIFQKIKIHKNIQIFFSTKCIKISRIKGRHRIKNISEKLKIIVLILKNILTNSKISKCQSRSARCKRDTINSTLSWFGDIF